MKMICVFCKKEISPKDNYHKNTEFKNEEEINTDYYHQTCWDKWTKQLDGASASLKKSNYLLNAMGNHMVKMGIIPEQEIQIR